MLLLFIAPCCSQTAVNRQDIITAAKNWVNSNRPMESTEVRAVNTITNNRGDVMLYEVTFDSTTVVLSGYRNCVPILITCTSHGLSIIDTLSRHIPCGLKTLISDYLRQISICTENANSNNLFDSTWTTLILGNSVGRSAVEPLIKTAWNQSESNTGYDYYAYNYYCISDSGCSHYPVGCGSVAMGQVMKYWNYPILQYDRTEQIDWCNITNTLDYGNMQNYDIHRNAIAKFLYNCAVDINTTFGCNESTSYLDSIYHALVDKYGYNALQPVRRYSNDDEWIGRIKRDIDFGYPIIYRGANSNNGDGHFFILDGYDSENRFHINWGWGNSFLNFYAYLGNFTPGNSDYNHYQWAIFKITAPGTGDVCSQNLLLDGFYQTFYSNPDNSIYHPYDVVPNTMTTLTSASSQSPSLLRTIPPGVTSTYSAHNEVILQDGFEAKLGSEFSVTINPCEQCDDIPYSTMAMGGSNEANNSLHYSDNNTPNNNIIVDSIFDIEPSNGKSQEKTFVFPNPVNKLLSIKSNTIPKEILIFDIQGHSIGNWIIKTKMRLPLIFQHLRMVFTSFISLPNQIKHCIR